MPQDFAMSAIFTEITSFITQVVSWMGTWLGAIVSNPILTFFVLVLPLFGIGIGVIHRLLRAR